MKASDWIKIKRDKDGFATEDCLDMMFTSLPIVVAELYPNGSILYHAICDLDSLDGWRGEIDRDIDYIYYLTISKLKL